MIVTASTKARLYCQISGGRVLQLAMIEELLKQLPSELGNLFSNSFQTPQLAETADSSPWKKGSCKRTYRRSYIRWVRFPREPQARPSAPASAR